MNRKGKRGATVATPRNAAVASAPAFWDAIHEQNFAAAERDVYPLRSAPERAILASALRHCRLRAGATVLELGCGSSRFLPHIARATGATVAGVDFSPAGVDQTRRALVRAGVDSDAIVLDRIETYAPAHRDAFDAVVSFGLVEHFDDLEGVIRLHFACVKPGGRVYVSLPNLTGVNLAWTRRVAPSLLKWHHAVAPEAVAAAARAAGGVDVAIDYLGGPRLFAPPDEASRRWIFLTAKAARKAVNGAGELGYRASPRVASAVGRSRLSAYFSVTSTRASGGD